MARYIDAHKLKKRIDCYPPAIRSAAMNAISHTKTENVAPVVRCKDCRYSMDDKIFGGMWCKGRKVTPDWFCADGAKMEEA